MIKLWPVSTKEGENGGGRQQKNGSTFINQQWRRRKELNDAGRDTWCEKMIDEMVREIQGKQSRREK